MRQVRSKDTSPELAVRKAVHGAGFRYRLHKKELPGKPDLVFPRYHAVVFINGCFWHNHNCRFGALPATRSQWWKKKLEGNRKRDEIVLSELHRMGWRTMIVWECSFRVSKSDRSTILDTIAGDIGRFILSKKPHAVITGPYRKSRTRKARTM